MADDIYAAIEQKIAEQYEGKVSIIRQSTFKPNVTRDGVIFQHADHPQISPTLYLDELVAHAIQQTENGMDFQDAIEQEEEHAVHFYEAHKDDAIQLPTLDAEFAKEHLFCTVINAERNVEMLKERGIVHFPLRETDLTIILKVRLEDGIGNTSATITVNEGLLASMKLTASEAYDLARHNTIYNDGNKARSLSEVLIEKGMPEEALAGLEDNMVMVSNDSECYGAAAIFVDKSLREEVSERLGGTFFVIPSSVHEVLCVAGDMDPQQLEAMIRDVNSTALNDEDFLSDHPTFCDERLQLHMVGIGSIDTCSMTDSMAESVGAHI